MTRRLRKLGVARWRSNDRTAPSSTPCSSAGFTVVVISPNQVKNLRGRYGSAGNKDDRFDAFVLADTLRTDRARLRPLVPDSPATVALAANLPRPKGSRRPPGRGGQPAPRPPAARVPRRGRPVRRHRLPDQPAFPGPLRLPGASRLALPQTPRGVAGLGRLLRRHRPGRAVRPADRRTPRRRRYHRHRADHPRHDRGLPPWSTRSRPCPRRSTNNSPSTPTRRSSPACPAPGPSGPPGYSPRSATAEPVSPPPNRWPASPASPLDPPIRQGQDRRVPLGLRQTTPRRGQRLRRRLPPRQPLGREPVQQAIARQHDHPHAVRILARAWLFVIWHCWQTHARTNPAKHRALQILVNQDQQREAA